MKIAYKIFITLCAVLYCLSSSSQNLVNMDDWVSNTSGATTNYNFQGTATQNSRITMTGPYGNPVTVWEASADGSAGMNGGFAHSGIVVNTDKTYRISFWVRSTGPNNCNNRIGFTPYYTVGGLVQPFDDENGESVSWPYISSRSQPNDKWFLVVGYVRSSSAVDIGDSGIYDPSQGTAPNLPFPSFTTTDFIFPSSVSQIDIRIRSFMWTCGSGEKMFLYDPRLEEVSNAAPLSNLLYGSNTTDTQSPTVPTGLTATNINDTSTDLAWNASTDNTAVAGYHIYNNGSSTPISSTTGLGTSTTLTNLSSGTTYQLSIAAYDAAGNTSTQSSPAVPVTTTSGGGGTTSSNWNQNGTNINYTSGSVSVGTTTIPSGYKMAIDGKLIAEEVKVQLSGEWADYVFLKDYKLPTLQEVKQHIQEKGHLINIPSAKEVEANGIELGEMNKLLLEKIEELTLYIIEQGKKQKLLEEQVKKLGDTK